MQSSLKRIFTGLILFILTIVVAIVGYMAAGWSLMDATYMVVITIFGVGYGEVRPIQSQELRIFTMLVIIAGTSSAVYAVGGFVQMITEGEIKRVLGARRMNHDIETLTGHVLICGYGRMGQILARQLSEEQWPFVVIDADDDRAAQAEAQGYLVRQGSAMDEEVLAAAGIGRALALATVLPDDAANVFITLTARGVNPQLQILARGELPSTEKKLRQAGADQVIAPAVIGAVRMARMITRPVLENLFEPIQQRSPLAEVFSQLGLDLEELPVDAHSGMAGIPIAGVELRGRGSFLIVALRRADGQMVLHPGPDVFVHRGDTLVVVGHKGDLPQLTRSHLTRRKVRYRGANLWR